MVHQSGPQCCNGVDRHPNQGMATRVQDCRSQVLTDEDPAADSPVSLPWSRCVEGLRDRRFPSLTHASIAGTVFRRALYLDVVGRSTDWKICHFCRFSLARVLRTHCLRSSQLVGMPLQAATTVACTQSGALRCCTQWTSPMGVPWRYHESSS